MEIEKVLYVEDNISKYMDVANYLKRVGVKEIEWVSNAEKAVAAIESASEPFDLFLFDMHFNYFGHDDHSAGEKLMNLLREKGIDTPIAFCSSQNWKIPGSVGNIFYHPNRYWEEEVDAIFDKLKK